MKAVILAGAELDPSPKLSALCQKADLLIAADSGVRHAKRLKVDPDLIIGDFDSALEDDLGFFPQVDKVQHPNNKALLDLELAIDYAKAQGAKQLHLLGVIGSRLDQSMAAMLIAAKLKQEGLNPSIHTTNQDVYFLFNERRSFTLPKGQTFSVLSMQEFSTVSIHNALYPLTRFRLAFGVGLGVSNQVSTPPLELHVHEGLITFIVEGNV